MRLHRLLGIIMLLDSRGRMNAENLSKILETSERTIYRDIDILCEAGIPIVATSGPNGGYSFMDNYKINSNTLESGDALNLLLSSMGIQPEKNSETAQKLNYAVIKLENSVSEEHRQIILKAKESFFIDSDPWWGKKAENKYVDIIKQSVLSLNKVKIYYIKYGKELSERIIRPYGVVVKNMEWYVIAYCELKNEIRIFKCNRIENIEILEEHFNMPTDFSLEDFWEKSKKQFVKKSTLPKPNSYPVKIKFYEEKKGLLKGFDINYFEKIGDSLIYIIDMLSYETACNVLFPLSDNLEIIEPSELKTYIIEKANKIININKLD